MVGGFAVGEIESNNVDTGTNQSFKNEGAIGGRPEGGNDFGMAGHGFPLFESGREFRRFWCGIFCVRVSDIR
jgi:acyl CoA:acetate/3-ketoacid CoA transferase